MTTLAAHAPAHQPSRPPHVNLLDTGNWPDRPDAVFVWTLLEAESEALYDEMGFPFLLSSPEALIPAAMSIRDDVLAGKLKFSYCLDNGELQPFDAVPVLERIGWIDFL